MKKLPNLHMFRDSAGKLRCYVRRAGSSHIPIPGAFGSPQFMAAYRAALRSPKVKKERAAKPQATKGPTVYFVRCGDFIKIGYATDVAGRLTELQVGAPQRLELLLTVAGTRRVERLMHAKFRDFRSQGEWFRSDPALLAFIGRERLKRERDAVANSHLNSG